MDTEINIYIFPICLKEYNVLIILTVISATSVLSARRNLRLKFNYIENDLENELPC